MRYLSIILLLSTQSLFAQNKLLDQTIAKIDLRQDTVKAVFDWITENVRYDVRKLSAIEDGSIKKKQGDHRTKEEYHDHLLQKVLETKRGVCQDYSLLFDAILTELGFGSFIIEGITQNSKGKVNRKVSHTWNAVQINGEWSLYDPTWGAGYIEDGKRFVKDYKPQWYKVDPKEMIKTHMPMDPIWQLSSNPINYKDFIEGQYQNSFDQAYDYPSLIEEFMNYGKKEQMQTQLTRSQKMESGMKLIDSWQRNLSKNIAQFGMNNNLDALDTATINSNAAVALFNDYVKAKNKQFKGSRYSIDKAKVLLTEAKTKTEGSLNIYKSIEVEDKKAVNFLNRSIKSSESLLKRINSELKFLEKIN